jgi:hypothetical protein
MCNILAQKECHPLVLRDAMEECARDQVNAHACQCGVDKTAKLVIIFFTCCVNISHPFYIAIQRSLYTNIDNTPLAPACPSSSAAYIASIDYAYYGNGSTCSIPTAKDTVFSACGAQSSCSLSYDLCSHVTCHNIIIMQGRTTLLW